MTEPQVVVQITDGDGAAREYAAILMPKDHAVVSGVATEDLQYVQGGRVLISEPDSSEPTDSVVGIAGMRVFPGSAGRPVTLVVKLDAVVANVTVPDSIGDDYPRLLAANRRDAVAALKLAGLTTELLPQPWGIPVGHEPNRPQPPMGWAPFQPSGGRSYAAFGICCFFVWGCC